METAKQPKQPADRNQALIDKRVAALLAMDEAIVMQATHLDRIELLTLIEVHARQAREGLVNGQTMLDDAQGMSDVAIAPAAVRRRSPAAPDEHRACR